MATVLEQLQSLLEPLAAGGSHAHVAMQGAQPPFIVWSEVSSTANNSLSGASALQNTRIQIDNYDRQLSAAKTLQRGIVAAMVAAPFSNIQLSSQTLFDAETKLYRCSMDFSIWSIN